MRLFDSVVSVEAHATPQIPKFTVLSSLPSQLLNADKWLVITDREPPSSPAGAARSPPRLLDALVIFERSVFTVTFSRAISGKALAYSHVPPADPSDCVLKVVRFNPP